MQGLGVLCLCSLLFCSDSLCWSCTLVCGYGMLCLTCVMSQTSFNHVPITARHFAMAASCYQCARYICHGIHLLGTALQVLHSLSKERLELINGLEPYVAERVLPLLKPVSKCWQPADYLPDPSKGDYLDQVSLHEIHDNRSR